MSVHITLVEPKVSTAGNFLIIDCLFAIVFVPDAKTIVTIEVRASGIAATAIAIANINEFIKSPPLKTSSANISAAKITIATPNFLPKSSSFC